LNMNMSLTRKLFASHLRQEGIQPEIIDMLQGRVSQSILTRHYLVPQSTLRNDVLSALKKLKKEIDEQ
jgi:intergrase/recombinase